jgi:hypothetical protein
MPELSSFAQLPKCLATCGRRTLLHHLTSDQQRPLLDINKILPVLWYDLNSDINFGVIMDIAGTVGGVVSLAAVDWLLGCQLPDAASLPLIFLSLSQKAK